MYNRYIRNDAGVYQRVPVQEGPAPAPGPAPHGDSSQRQAYQEDPPHYGGQEQGGTRRETASMDGFPPFSAPGNSGKKGFLSSLLGKLKLDEIDTGDLLLLVILFLLFKDGEDEELLIALGLLLIL